MFTTVANQAFVRNLVLAQEGTDATTRRALADRAASERARVLAEQTARGGIAPLYRQVVDGVAGAALDTVAANGVIVFGWQYLAEIVRDTVNALVLRSPALTGNYIDTIEVMIDGQAAARGPDGAHDLSGVKIATREVAVVATADYARKLEVGRRADGSPFVRQVAPHVVEETCAVARRLWGNLAAFEYNYVTISDPYLLRTRKTQTHLRKRGFVGNEMTYPSIKVSPRVA